MDPFSSCENEGCGSSRRTVGTEFEIKAKNAEVADLV
jgi:hypothetical protein